MASTYNKVNLFNSFTMYMARPAPYINIWFPFDFIQFYDFQKYYLETLRPVDHWKINIDIF